MFLHACALQFERVNLMVSPTLGSLEEIVRRMIVDEARTQEEVSGGCIHWLGVSVLGQSNGFVAPKGFIGFLVSVMPS